MKRSKRPSLEALLALAKIGGKIEIRADGESGLFVTITSRRQDAPIVRRYSVCPRGHADVDLIGDLTTAARGTA